LIKHTTKTKSLNKLIKNNGDNMNQRLAIAIENNNTCEKVAEHFGRCSKFYVCEIDEQKKVVSKEIYFNPIEGEQHGACQLPSYIKQFNVNTIIAGGMGRNAVASFQNHGINVITAPGLLFEDAVRLFSEGKLSGYEICQHSHHEHGHHHHSRHNHKS
jgi:predicted Fe-Mo cluster-binding NifX family protein